MPTRQVRLGDGYLTLDPGLPGVKELSEQVTKVIFQPNSSTGDSVPVLSGDVLPGDYTEAPNLSGQLLPDFGEASSVQEWLLTNAGKQVQFEFVPNKTKSRKITGTLQVTGVPVGGTVKSSDRVDFDFPVQEYTLAAYTPIP